MTWVDGWTGLWGRLRVFAALGYTAVFGCSAVPKGIAVLGIAASKGTVVLGCQYVTMGLGWLRLWVLLSGHSADFDQVYVQVDGSDILMGPQVMFSLGFNHVALRSCCLGCDSIGDVCAGLYR